MERKIGEIFEYNGEWYQCVEGTCRNCSSYYDTVCKNITTIGSTNFGNCHCSLRTDHKSVIFKKLEKVGEPFTIAGKQYQHYKVFDIDNVCGDGFWCVHNYKAKILTIEIKQTKEDMEEKDIKPYDKIFSEGTVSNTENLVTSSLKPFDLEAAKAGKPVCTRDGRKARIICFDVKGDVCPIIALIEENGIETTYHYDKNGQNAYNKSELDLMMLPEKKEGWVNVYKERCYETREEAIRHIAPGTKYVDTIRVEWEE